MKPKKKALEQAPRKFFKTKQPDYYKMATYLILDNYAKKNGYKNWKDFKKKSGLGDWTFKEEDQFAREIAEINEKYEKLKQNK